MQEQQAARMKQQLEQHHGPAAAPVPRHTPQPPPAHHARNLLYVDTRPSGPNQYMRGSSFIQGRERMRTRGYAPVNSPYPPPPHHTRRPVQSPYYTPAAAQPFSSPNFLETNNYSPAPSPAIPRSQENILDPSFWNRVKPLPVIALEQPAQGPNAMSFIDLGSPGAAGRPQQTLTMADLSAYGNFDRQDPMRPTMRDVAFSQAVRAQQHPEPILPDLPIPPVVVA